MPKEYKVRKISDTEIEVRAVTTTENVSILSYAFLVAQLESIQKQQERDNELRLADLEEVRYFLSKCKELGVNK